MPLDAGVTLYFVRHGETEWNRIKRLQGQTDIPLNDTGRAQAADNGRRLRDTLGDALDRLDFVSSPLVRSRETMEILREAAGLEPSRYRIDPVLKEIHYGNWEGAFLEELKRKDPEGYAERRSNKLHWRPIDGESYAELRERVAGWLDTVREDTVVVSHGGVSRVLRGLVLSELDEREIPNLPVPQDQVMQVTSGAVSWF